MAVDASLPFAPSPLETATLWRLIGDEEDRIRSYKRAWNAYNGNYPDAVRSRPGQPDDNVKMNPARTIVDKGAYYLFGNDIKFSIEDADQATLSEKPQANDTHTLYLSSLWRKQQQQSFLTKLAINGGVCGHAFVKIIPADPFPRLVVIDPATITVATDPQDYQFVTGYKIQYNSIDPATRKPNVHRQLIVLNDDRQGWTITDQVSDITGAYISIEGYSGTGNWRTVGKTDWPFAWAPIVDCQNLPAPNQYYGQPDLTDDVLHLVNVINGVLSNRNRVVRLKGHPLTWGRGFGANQLDFSPENTIVVRSEKGQIQHLEMQSDMKPTKELYDDLRQALFEQAHIPPISMGQLTTFGNISGLALKIAYAPILEACQVKRRLYGYMLEDLNSRLIDLKFGVQGVSTVIHWPDIVPTDDMAQGQSFQIDQTLGASSDTLLSRRGYDAKFELSKRKEEVAAGEAPPIVAMPSTAKGEGLPGDMRTPSNQNAEPDSQARRQSDRAKSDGDNTK